MDNKKHLLETKKLLWNSVNTVHYIQIHRIEMTHTVDMMEPFNALTELSSNLVLVESSCSPSQSPAGPQLEPPTLGSSPAPVPASPLKHTYTEPLVISTSIQITLRICTLRNTLSEIWSVVGYLRQRMTSVSLPQLPLWFSSCSQGCGTLYLGHSQTWRYWSRGTATLMITKTHTCNQTWTKVINHKD